MIPLLSRGAVRALDADAVERLGVPSIVLMENAGRGACDAICERYPQRLERVVIVGGRGQNGGDGWVIARHLFQRGYWPRAVLLADPRMLTGDAATNWAVLDRLGVATNVVPGEDQGALVSALAGASLIVDGLFGTGLDRAVEGPMATAISLMNAAAAPTVALDLPSGVHADRGSVLGEAVLADMTVTFAARKPGLYQYPGAALAGERRCVSIGVPADGESEVALVEDADVPAMVPPRPLDAHKGLGGQVLVLAGESGRTGAALLAGTGALRIGAGLVTLAARDGGQARLDSKVVELMTAALPAGDADALVAGARALAESRDAVVLGPGFGTDAVGAAACRRLALELPVAAVLDADALTALGTDCARLTHAAGPRVLTPHPGEAGRLLGIAASEVQRDRYGAARALAEATGAVVILKGAGSVIAEPARTRVSAAGTPAMAVAGTGDVLAGVVAALLAGGAEPFEAATAAVQLHGRAGELAAVSDRGLLASERAARLPAALEACRAATNRQNV